MAAPTFEIVPEGPNVCRLKFQGIGEIGGLVAGVGQRILASVSKHLVGKFFTALRKEFDNPVAGAAWTNSRNYGEGWP